MTKTKNRPRGTSYASRCFQQLQKVTELYAVIKKLPKPETELDEFNQATLKDLLILELDKAELVVAEREEVLRRQREAYGKRGNRK